MAAETTTPGIELLTLRDWVRWGASLFNANALYFGHGTDNALDEALALVLHAVHLDHSLPASFLDARVTQTEAQRIAQLMKRRVDERVPLAYLTGHARFAGLDFIVTPDVLIPRSPIAELIEASFQPWINPDSIDSVLDLCCGSGCIGIATAVALPDAHVDLVDISDKAIAVAEKNIQRHRLDAQVSAIESDLFECLDGRRYDLILCNPPYVSSDEYAALSGEYHQEPILGLEAGGDGLDVVRRILEEAADFLNPGGVLIVEVGSAAAALIDNYPDLPFTWLDFAHGGDGVFLLSREELVEAGDDE